MRLCGRGTVPILSIEANRGDITTVDEDNTVINDSCCDLRNKTPCSMVIHIITGLPSASSFLCSGIRLLDLVCRFCTDPENIEHISPSYFFVCGLFRFLTYCFSVLFTTHTTMRITHPRVGYKLVN